MCILAFLVQLFTALGNFTDLLTCGLSQQSILFQELSHTNIEYMYTVLYKICVKRL